MASKAASVGKSPAPSSAAVYTLGQFRIEVDGQPLRMGQKAQRKPLDLLKLLVALGGNSIPVETLTDSLWPDADGDQAQGAFSSALHRLRNLIGHDAVRLVDSRLTLNPECCWVDCSAFNERLDLAAQAAKEGAEDAAWQHSETALGLYGGPFLEGEFDLAEVLAAREKLHGVFLRHIGQLGEFFSQKGQLPQAILLYQRGLEIDELAEEIYQKLMLAYQQLGRHAEGVSVYQRLQKVLKASVGIDPSPESEAIYRALTSSEPKQEAVKSEIGEQPGNLDSEPMAQPSTAGNAELATLGQPSSLDRPEKPSIAVLPFTNMSADPSQEFFADGLVEEILTSLSKVSAITVIARNSSFAYRGKAFDVRQVAQELGVRYVMEGGVRQGGNRLRITAQLIDSADGSQIWAEQYDRVVEDIFDIQDEITKEIVTALRVRLSDSEQALIFNRGTNNVQAWGQCVEALEYFNYFNPADHAKALELIERAVSLDPEYGLAWALLGNFHWYDSRTAFTADSHHAFARALEMEEKARAVDETNPWLFALSIFLRISERNFGESVKTAERALSLHPGSAHIRHMHGVALLANGQPEQAVSMTKDAIRLNPHYPPPYSSWLSRALDVAGKPREAMEVIAAGLQRNPTQFGLFFNRAAILSRDGSASEAKEAVADLRRNNPNFRTSHVQQFLAFRDQKYVDTVAECLRKAGLPE